MNYLLDTHAFLWLIFEPSQLSKEVRAVLQDPSNNIHLSSVSCWEISLKLSLKKLVLKDCKPEDLLKLAEKLDLELIELSAEEAIRFHSLPKMTHKDPFDRILAWQAIQRNLILITKDKNLTPSQELGLKVLW